MSAQPVLLINVFTVEAAKQKELVALISQATAEIVRQAQGLISAKLHQSLDSTKVTIYAEWESEGAYQAM